LYFPWTIQTRWEMPGRDGSYKRLTQRGKTTNHWGRSQEFCTAARAIDNLRKIKQRIPVDFRERTDREIEVLPFLCRHIDGH